MAFAVGAMREQGTYILQQSDYSSPRRRRSSAVQPVLLKIALIVLD
jgi:hypothetical protein